VEDRVKLYMIERIQELEKKVKELERELEATKNGQR
jgi:hypothetical protein